MSDNGGYEKTLRVKAGTEPKWGGWAGPHRSQSNWFSDDSGRWPAEVRTAVTRDYHGVRPLSPWWWCLVRVWLLCSIYRPSVIVPDTMTAPLPPDTRSPGIQWISDHRPWNAIWISSTWQHNNLILSCHSMFVSKHLVMLTLMVLLSLASMTAGGPKPGLDVESVADKIMKKIGKNFNLLLLCKRSFI